MPAIEKRFATNTGRRAVIGSLDNVVSLLSRTSGTTIIAGALPGRPRPGVFHECAHKGSEPRRLRGNDMRTTTPTQAAGTPSRLRVLESPRHGFASELAHDGVELPPLIRPHLTKDATAPSFAQTLGQHR